MFNFLKRTRKGAEPAPNLDDLTRRATARFIERGDDGPQAGATWDEGEEGLRDYETFCTDFQHQSGSNFMEFLRAERIPELERWLHPSNPSAEARVFIRLMVEMMRRGENLWDQVGIYVYADDWVRREKATPKETRAVIDALATLTVMLKKPIKLFFEDEKGVMKVWEFLP